MLQYHVAYHLPSPSNAMVVAEVLDFSGVVSQGFDLQDARTMVASAFEEMAELYLEQGATGAPRNDRTAGRRSDRADAIVHRS